METAGARAGGDVPNRSRRSEPPFHRRSRKFRAGFTGTVRGARTRMSVIEVLAPGLLTTVQDLGREGFGPMGVSPSGAADPVALRIGNRLAGNTEDAAGLERRLP